jgi:hypothetical protein
MTVRIGIFGGGAAQRNHQWLIDWTHAFLRFLSRMRWVKEQLAGLTLRHVEKKNKKIDEIVDEIIFLFC